MYANHVTGTHGQGTVEVHITPEERRGLPVGARQALRALGTLIDDGLDGSEAGEVWHLRQADALAIEAIIDEAS